MANNKKKLLVTASTFPRWEGDTEPRFVLDLSKSMTEEYDVTVLVPAASGAKDEEELEGVKVIRYHYFPIHRWETLCYPGAIVPRIREKKIRILLVPCLFIGLWGKLRQILPEYDIVHAHWLLPQGIVQSFFRKPYIVTGHGGDVTSLNKGILKWLKRRALRHAGGVTVVSQYLKGRVREIAPDCRPEVISMGVNTAKFGRQYFQENYFGQGDKKVVLFVGRLAEKKGVAYLIEAMKGLDALLEHGGDRSRLSVDAMKETAAMLVIVGDGPLREELMCQAEEATAEIVFLGSKTHEELKTIYASADVFAAPSITARDGDQEGVPTAIMEALASGLPVVASDSSGIREIIEDGVNGLLCEEKNVHQLAENIHKILADEQLRERLQQGAVQTVERFDYRNIAPRYCKLLRNIEEYEPHISQIHNVETPGKFVRECSECGSAALRQEPAPLVSVIIPVYNVKAYLDQCLESVLQQTYSNLEILLVDDGSTDGSGEKCDEYALKDNRIKVMHKPNGGLSDARNAGLDHMTGDYVTFVDADDYIDMRLVEMLLDQSLRTGSDIVSGGYVKTAGDTEEIRRRLPGGISKSVLDSKAALLRVLYRQNLPGYTPGKLYHALIFRNLRFPTGRLFEDTVTTCRAIKVSEKVCVVEESLYYYRQRPGSIVNLQFKTSRLDEVYHAREILKEMGTDPDLKTAAEAYLFFALMDNYILTDAKHVKERKYLEKKIRIYRKNILKNRNAGKSLRVMAGITYFPGMGAARILGKLYKCGRQIKRN